MATTALTTWLARVWFEVASGGVLRAVVWNVEPAFVLGAGALLAAAVGALLARAMGTRLDRDETLALAAAFAWGAVLTGLAVFARWGEPAAALVDDLHGRRYLHVQQLLVVVGCGWLIVRAIGRRAFPRAWLGALALWIALLNASDRLYFEMPVADGERTRRFVRELARLERERPGERLRLERGEWSIDVRARGADGAPRRAPSE
jgi:hypothetical protein